MWLKLLPLALIQSALLAIGQVFLKYGLQRMVSFDWNWTFFKSALLNWQFAMSGITIGAASLLWMYIIRQFPLSLAYPMGSLSYVFTMLFAILFFHENVDIVKWIGLFFIITGCILLTK